MHHIAAKHPDRDGKALYQMLRYIFEKYNLADQEILRLYEIAKQDSLATKDGSNDDDRGRGDKRTPK